MSAASPISRLRVDCRVLDPAWRRDLPGAARLCRRAARAAYRRAAASPGAAELAVVLCDDASVRGLNRRFRGVDRATNVLAFPAGEGAARRLQPRLLGDVVLARGRVTREAARQGKGLAAHVSHLVVHGVLHLLGHDHQAEPEAEMMEGLEVAVLAALGVANPYRTAATGRRS
jgi:probable rRNA maturation factor